MHKRTLKMLRAVPALILLGGLLLTYGLQREARDAAQSVLDNEFTMRAGEVSQNISRRLQAYEQVLQGVAGLFASGTEVDRKRFADYLQALRLEGKYPGLLAVGYARRLPAPAKAAHVAAVRAEGFPAYEIWPVGDRPLYTAIVYVEPFEVNRRVFGYDMYSDPVRREAMNYAGDHNSAGLSGKVKLLRESDSRGQQGVILYLPIYRRGAALGNEVERQEALLGWVYAAFRMSDLMDGMVERWSQSLRESVDIEIYDGEQVGPDSLMFDMGRYDGASLFHSHQPLLQYGRRWTLVVHSLPAFDQRLRSDKAQLLVMTGTVVSLLLAAVVWLLVSGHARALVLAEKMTDELRHSEVRLRKLNRALRLLSDCNMALVHAEDEYKLLAEICRLCVERGGYMMAWVGYAEDDAERNVRPLAQFGYESGYLDSVNISWADNERGQGPTGTAIRTRQTSINQSVLTNPLMAPWRAAALQRGYQASIALPLVGGDGRALGALTVYAREADAFDAEEVRLLEELATDLAYGISTLRAQREHEMVRERADFLANFDPLTHLPNRLLLRDRFEHALQLAEAREQLAVCYLDMDNFQQINDALGHELGDQVLLQAAERLRSCVPASDTVGRLGGDEFLLLLSGLVDASGVLVVADAVREAFAEPLEVAGNRINVAFSIGISIYPADGDDFDTLLQHADTAVHNAKESGRNTYRFFTRAMNADQIERMRLTGAMPAALRNREFCLHYQPQIDLHSGRITGAEALVRWLHPEDGMIPPGRFIPLAEHSGLIVPLGEWVLFEACRQARAWQEQFAQPLLVAVNLSALQFKRSDVYALARSALAAAELPASCLELELTESILLQDMESTMKTLRQLKGLGVKLSIDDFGTGYSSLSYLKQLAVDKLKIDQSFVRDMLASEDGATLVQAIIQLGHSLQLEVIAEGVETVEQNRHLLQAGCDAVQGYWYSRPLPAGEFAALLAEQGTAGFSGKL